MEAAFTAWTFRSKPGLRPRGLAREFARATTAAAAGAASRRGVPAIFASRTNSRAAFATILPESLRAALAVTPDWRQRRPRVGAAFGLKLRT
jgi:hypothetical protein